MNATPVRFTSGLFGSSPVRAAMLALLGLCALAGCGSLQTLQTAITPPNELARQKGIELYNEHNLVDAEAAFNSAVRQLPSDYQSHYYLGRTYDALGSYQQAIQSYHTALDVMKTDLLGREDTAMRQKILDGLAVSIANNEDHMAQPASARQMSSKSAEDQFVLAKVLRIHGDADGAIDAYDRAANLAPESLPITREYALYLDQLNLLLKARPVLVRAYQLNRKASNLEDVKINTALRRCNVVPGPGLMEEKDLTRPPVPIGPLPEIPNPFAPADAPATSSGPQAAK